ncbi:hypothetical protein NMY22_g15153 [Coprinellus aureogranulatus]|nr:hypothetical protein NMY22_g15153 [Coprinellus aureogranulatus]
MIGTKRLTHLSRSQVAIKLFFLSSIHITLHPRLQRRTMGTGRRTSTRSAAVNRVPTKVLAGIASKRTTEEVAAARQAEEEAAKESEALHKANLLKIQTALGRAEDEAHREELSRKKMAARPDRFEKKLTTQHASQRSKENQEKPAPKPSTSKKNTEKQALVNQQVIARKEVGDRRAGYRSRRAESDGNDDDDDDEGKRAEHETGTGTGDGGDESEGALELPITQAARLR